MRRIFSARIREQEIIARLTDDVVPERKEEYTAIVRKVMEVSRKYQYGLMYDWDPELVYAAGGGD